MKEKLSKDLCIEISTCQVIMVVVKILKKKFPFAYTNSNMGDIFRNLELESKGNKALARFKEITKDLDVKGYDKYVKDNELQNAFSYDLQKDLMYDLIGKKISVEEFMESEGIV